MRIKNRLDVEMVARGLVGSREKARAYIMAGDVYVNGQRADKPAVSILEADEVVLKGAALPYVSRGGLKLEKAVSSFGLDLQGKICLDVGASTGGFTDCMLQNGAAYVYAVDVGYGQLDWKLRNDARVFVLERHNARHMESDWFAHTPNFAGMDVSFISISLILPALYNVLAGGAEMVCLVKPQFEAGRTQVGKNGVVREPALHVSVLAKAMSAARSAGFALCGADFSPITGPQGNIEFLLYLKKDEESLWTIDQDEGRSQGVVQAAHDALGKSQ